MGKLFRKTGWEKDHEQSALPSPKPLPYPHLGKGLIFMLATVESGWCFTDSSSSFTRMTPTTSCLLVPRNTWRLCAVGGWQLG